MFSDYHQYSEIQWKNPNYVIQFFNQWQQML